MQQVLNKLHKFLFFFILFYLLKNTHSEKQITKYIPLLKYNDCNKSQINFDLNKKNKLYFIKSNILSILVTIFFFNSLLLYCYYIIDYLNKIYAYFIFAYIVFRIKY